MHDPSASQRLIVALDMKDPDAVWPLVDALGEAVSFYKVGMVRVLDTGTELVRRLAERGKKVFLDLKSFDIDKTVASTVALAAANGATFVTVHGNSGCIRAAKEAAGPDLKVLSVTVLTSLSRADVAEVYGIEADASEVAVSMAKVMRQAGCDGVIASPWEAGRLRSELGPDALIVTPGVRMGGSATHDHARPGTPRQAIADGADYLVVGRPIYAASDPRAAAREHIAEIEKGLEERGGR